MNVNFTNFKIGYGKKRLGFCNSKHEICISWYLIMQPLYVIEYVIVHELAHLVHFNHSSLFWNLVNYHYPNYVKAEYYLKTKEIILL
jgi:predicted metal-dependent hydrolase